MLFIKFWLLCLVPDRLVHLEEAATSFIKQKEGEGI